MSKGNDVNMNAKVEAYEYLLGRGVTRLCHFTKVKSLTHILTSEDGILATKFIPKDIKQQNDTERLDNTEDYVSCSFQYPNCWYWKSAKKRDHDDIFKEWVVLSIDLGILKERDFKFSPCNAAAGCGRHIVSDPRRLREVFKEQINQRCRQRTMLSCCPTDDQAEIMVYKNIPVSHVNGIIVGNGDSANNIAAIIKTVGKVIPVYVSAAVCGTLWSGMIRQGEKPTETEYIY
jgi:hypothetical protein